MKDGARLLQTYDFYFEVILFCFINFLICVAVIYRMDFIWRWSFKTGFIYCLPYFQTFLSEYDQFSLATSYFDLKEYDRAAFFLKDCTSPKCYFLHMYSRYLADEKRKLDKASDSIGKFCDYIYHLTLNLLNNPLIHFWNFHYHFRDTRMRS